ncbi:hypothetical protein BRD18_08055 [Halobacteriales archaeon SW_7_71_33]|nr:MAG: hypothetical protein BRD18_08055 [Halobacteriales archaeon SW_7_71_33]
MLPADREDMRRRALLSAVTASSLAGIGGCIGVIGGGNQGSCTAPSADDLNSLLPEGDDQFTGQYATSVGLDGLGTDSYVAGQYTGPDGEPNGMVVAEYDSNDEAQNNRSWVAAKAELPATGYVVAGRFVVAVDAQSEELARALMRASSFGDACAAQLTFVEATGGRTDEKSTTGTDRTTTTRTTTETDVTSPRGSKAVEYDIKNGNAKLTTGEKLRFDAPWTLDTLVRYPESIQPSNYAVRFGSGGGGFIGGSAANLGIGLNVSDAGSETRRRATAKIGGELVGQSQTIEQILRADTWYRVRARHGGDGQYRLKLWPASTSEDDAYVATSRGDPPETTADEKLPLRVFGGREKGSVRIQTAYLDYRTDAAADG